MIIEILDLALDLLFGDAMQLRMLARYTWPSARRLVGEYLRLAAAAVLEHVESMAERRRLAAADRQLLARLQGGPP